MFVYMSKKIAIPKQSSVNCISWNQTSGFIAVGGDDGMLKVLKLESGGGGNLSMNLTLEGHSGQLEVAIWNEVHQKLTTSDEHGVIIVWMLYKGSWYEEMINNRNKSTVRGMAWGSDGQKICIAYEDGAVIVGSVDGSRVWGKDLKGPGLSAVQWSPDNMLLLFGLSNGELHLYDSQGNFAMQVMSHVGSTPLNIVGLHWYSGKAPAGRPVLAICFRNGNLQLMKNYNDDGMILVETALAAVDCKWNHNGTVLAVAGTTKDDSNAIQFFNPYGEHLRSLRVPGGSMRAISWEGRSLRLAIAVDSFIYFANVKPDHKYAYYGNTLVFCSGPETVTFWDTSTHQTWINCVPGVVDMAGADEYCVLATTSTLVVCNQQGIQCDAKVLGIPITRVALNSKGIVVAASRDCFVIWKFSTPTRQGTVEQFFNSEAQAIQAGEACLADDPICCIACSDSHLVLGRESGMLISFSLSSHKKLASTSLSARPYKIGINCNSTKLYVIESGGGLQLLETELAGGGGDGGGGQVRRDAWACVWAADNAQLLAVAEKARVYVLRAAEPTEPLPANGYLCSFKDLEITSALLDEIGGAGEACGPQHVCRVEVKSLRDTRQLLDKVSLRDAEAFVKDNPHPHLWLLVAEAALRAADSEGALDTAEAAFVRRGDYAGVRFVRRLHKLRAPKLRQAEICAYFKQFDAAEKIYIDEDRRDLAIALRQRVGHWFRVVELYKRAASTPEPQLLQAYNNIADHYYDTQKWQNAVEYYKMAKNTEGLAKCYVALEDNESLAKLNVGSPIKSKERKGSAEADTYEASQPAPSLAGVLRLTEQGRMLHAAAMASELANIEASKKTSPVKIKKLYVLAGLLYSQNSVEGARSREAARCWRSAAAQHWLALASGRAQARPPRPEPALRAAAALQPLIPLLHSAQHLQAWCTIALIAAEAKAFDTCSKAFIKLESIDDSGVFENLAIDIFTQHEPKDPKTNKVECPHCRFILSDWMVSCGSCGAEFPSCGVTGRPLYDADTVWTCAVCGQHAQQHEMVLRHSCPLCHAQL